MTDWYVWNDVRCTSYGVHVLEQPPLTMPSERVTFTDVPGRSGSLTTLQGDDVYDDMLLTAQCIVADPARIPSICAWLRGGGKVTFANRSGGFYNARIVNQISFEKILRGNPHRSFAINFRCKPFWYLGGVAPITLMTSHNYIINPGNVFSEPVLQITMNGNAAFTVGGTYFELMDIYGTVTVDTPRMETFMNYTSYNSRVWGDYPRLLPGNNLVSWSGSVSRIVITPNWRMV